jgi:hypothetical protein
MEKQTDPFSETFFFLITVPEYRNFREGTEENHEKPQRQWDAMLKY